jgi:uncharacterized protein (TIGR02246 family)
MKKILFVLIAIVPTSNVQAQVQEEIAIKKVVNNFETVFNIKDAKATANLWAEDADYITHTGALVHGRQELEKYFQSIFTQFYQTAQNKLFEPSVRFLKSDIAAVDVKWEVTGATSADGKPLPAFKGIMVWTMTKENNNWVIKIMHNVTLPESGK